MYFVVSKVFEGVLPPLLFSKCLVSDKQFDFWAYRACTSAHRLVRKILRHFDFTCTPLYMCSVETTATFNLVLLPQFLLAQIESDVDNRIVRVLRDWYLHWFIQFVFGWVYEDGQLKAHLYDIVLIS